MIAVTVPLVNLEHSDIVPALRATAAERLEWVPESTKSLIEASQTRIEAQVAEEPGRWPSKDRARHALMVSLLPG